MIAVFALCFLNIETARKFFVIEYTSRRPDIINLSRVEYDT